MVAVTITLASRLASDAHRTASVAFLCREQHVWLTKWPTPAGPFRVNAARNSSLTSSIGAAFGLDDMTHCVRAAVLLRHFFVGQPALVLV